MNERIRELALQAGIESYPAKLLVNTDEEGKVSSKWEIPLEKFAESIVEECVTVLNNRFMGDMNREDLEVRRCIADVKHHFGVE